MSYVLFVVLYMVGRTWRHDHLGLFSRGGKDGAEVFALSSVAHYNTVHKGRGLR